MALLPECAKCHRKNAFALKKTDEMCARCKKAQPKKKDDNE